MIEIISNSRQQGKHKELLEKIDKMLREKKIVFAFSSEQLKERDKKIRNNLLDSIISCLEDLFDDAIKDNKIEESLSDYVLDYLDLLKEGNGYGKKI